MNIDDNGNSYAEMQAVPFSHSESRVPSNHDIVDDGYGQIPVLMGDGEGKDFMVHFADDRDMENIDEELELGVGGEGLKMSFQHERHGRETSDATPFNPIPDQERFLPIANVARVMKRMIPNSGKIAKDAKECVQECVSEFISFITSEANDKCMSEKRKTISADDLLEAINNMGFDNYVAPLQLFLERYRAAHKLNSAFPNTPTSVRNFNTVPQTNTVTVSSGSSSAMPMSRDYSNRPAQSLSTSSANSHTFQAAATSHASPDLPASTSSSTGTPVVLSSAVSGMSVTALQQQPMQIYIDPASKQHYMAIETEQGMQLYPIQIQTDGPVAYSFAPDVVPAVTSSNGNTNQAFIMMAGGEVDESTMTTISPPPAADRNHAAVSSNSGSGASRASNHEPHKSGPAPLAKVAERRQSAV
ncbi:unnamed protein product [Nippostrongylus brasiliensis]|uniref:Nuclear transcription factor Y subunit beta n=1 Tax=Nippostrongylus brasiliensis TaxID=27835 RepID=A0A0N4XTP0_NIPBR|nr:unnamed protein product [Nippostrongylus brasiliensis]